MSEGLDFSWARPGGAAIRAAGRQFVVRYLYPGGGKGLTRAEEQDYQNNGLLTAFVYEEDGHELAGGFAAGVRVAQAAESLRISLGLPNIAVHFAVDFNAQGATLNACVEGIKGAASVLGYDRTGGYGGKAFIDAIAPYAKYRWQTYAWSAGQVSASATLYQYLNGQTVNGGSVDFCRNLTADFGAFGGTLAPSSAGSMSGSNTSGHTTQEVQAALNRFGYKLVVDGIYGPATTGAAVAFQKGHGLTADGIVGPITWAALTGSAAAAPAAAAPSGLVVDGVWGTLTTEAEQHALGVTVDGIRGPQTIAAEQRKTGAVVDGVDGPDTRKHLQRYLGVTQDGVIGPITTRALQSRLNSGSF